MPTLVSLHRPTALVRGARGAVSFAALAAATTLTACGGGGDGGGGAVGPSGSRASVSVAGQVLLAPGTTGAAVTVTPAYERTSGDPVALVGAKTVNVSGTSASVPLDLDLSACLADPAHSGGDACNVRMTVTLAAGDRTLDAQTVGPVALKGGGSATQSVSLAEVASVRVTAPATRVELGQTLAATATALDANGGALSGRTVTWASSAPTVAAVNAATGVVTPAATGAATLVATVAGRQGTLDITVARPAQTITIGAGTGAGSGTITSSVGSPAALNCRLVAGTPSGTCTASIPADAPVTLTAAADAGSAFGAWSGSACAASGGALTCTFTPTSAQTVSASFAVVRTLTVSLAGTGSGSVTSTPAGVSCASNGAAGCTRAFGEGASVTLTANASGPNRFAGWGGACASAGTASTCTLAMSEARAASATFTAVAADSVRVSVLSSTGAQFGGELTFSGTFEGRPLVTGIAITMLTTQPQPGFEFYVDPGSSVTLRFAPNGQSRITSWGGACAGTPATSDCTIASPGTKAVSITLGAR